MGIYYRIQPASRDVQALLDPATWRSRCWEPVEKRCDACGGEGCEQCGWQGWVEDIRHGVSACASLEDLRRYFLRRGAYFLDTVLVEMEADLSDDEDFDAEDGAVLVLPQRIVSVTPIEETGLFRFLGRDLREMVEDVCAQHAEDIERAWDAEEEVLYWLEREWDLSREQLEYHYGMDAFRSIVEEEEM